MRKDGSQDRDLESATAKEASARRGARDSAQIKREAEVLEGLAIDSKIGDISRCRHRQFVAEARVGCKASPWIQIPKWRDFLEAPAVDPNEFCYRSRIDRLAGANLEGELPDKEQAVDRNRLRSTRTGSRLLSRGIDEQPTSFSELIENGKKNRRLLDDLDHRNTQAAELGLEDLVRCAEHRRLH